MKRLIAILIIIGGFGWGSVSCMADYLGSYNIDDTVTISATTHAFATGVATTATTPTVTIYEDDSTTQTSIDAAAMTVDFDSITGLNVYKATLSAANGFESGKHYTAVIAATVSGVAGITTHNFQINARVNIVSVNGNPFPCTTEQLVSDGATATDIWQTVISSETTVGGAGTYLKTLYDDWLDGGRLDLLLDAIPTNSSATTDLVSNAGYLGDYQAGKTIYFLWRTYDGNGAAANPSAAGTVKVYANDSATEITAPTGITDTRGFDSTTGLHLCKIDLSANTTFYLKKKDYSIVLSGATIDSQTVNAVIGTFSIENKFTEKQFIPR